MFTNPLIDENQKMKHELSQIAHKYDAALSAAHLRIQELEAEVRLLKAVPAEGSAPENLHCEPDKPFDLSGEGA